MNIKKQIEITTSLLEGIREFNGEYQDGWDDDIVKGEKLLEYLKEQKQELKSEVSEAIYLLRKNQIDNCPDWNDGDCKKDSCDFCRIEKCIENLETLI